MPNGIKWLLCNTLLTRWQHSPWSTENLKANLTVLLKAVWWKRADDTLLPTAQGQGVGKNRKDFLTSGTTKCFVPSVKCLCRLRNKQLGREGRKGATQVGEMKEWMHLWFRKIQEPVGKRCTTCNWPTFMSGHFACSQIQCCKLYKAGTASKQSSCRMHAAWMWLLCMGSSHAKQNASLEEFQSNAEN